MGFKSRLAEEAARHIVQAASKEVGKHVSKKAIDQVVSSSKKKVVGTFDAVRDDFFPKKNPTKDTYRPSEPAPHVCNCIGCCGRCGSCRTWPGHTEAYCDLLVRQREERERMGGQ